MIKPRPPRVHWHPTHGWIVDTIVGLEGVVLAAVVAYAKRMQADRVRSWPRGDRRDDAERALAQLTVENIRQNILPAHPWEQDRIILEA